MKKRDKISRKRNKRDETWACILAGIFLGMGFGFLFDNIAAGLFIGLGAGFVFMIVLKFLNKK